MVVLVVIDGALGDPHCGLPGGYTCSLAIQERASTLGFAVLVFCLSVLGLCDVGCSCSLGCVFVSRCSTRGGELVSLSPGTGGLEGGRLCVTGLSFCLPAYEG